MNISPQLKPFVDAAAHFPKVDSIPLAVLRKAVRDASLAFPPLAVPIAKIEDRVIAGPAGDLRLRLYTPASGTPAPVLVYFHGGGFVMGDLDTQDMICRGLCHAAGCLVVSVDYRLAPEHPFPAGPDDCWAATCWAADHAEEIGGIPGRLAVAGDSAGAVLAASVALRARDEGGPQLDGQVLIYGSGGYPRGETASWRDYPVAPFISTEDTFFYWHQYLSQVEAQRDNPLASPNRAESHVGAAPAFIATAEFDPTRDDAEGYGLLLVAAGVPVTTRRYVGMVHGFVSWLGVIDAAQTAVDDVGGWLRQQFSAKAG
ncbi:alpha/beta hydrolase [Nitrospirillum bahiense]|uniref:Acetyl esterase n=1 Tax=Nitrospirillum amazonense TaxID=28077 RepID=A0A560FVQ8_9PROT|nr:alpha/beta hydrolase [Nitrospirillum amazonense]TWB25641.1 acetyl esterase [Nitrospirillum amazonense]